MSAAEARSSGSTIAMASMWWNPVAFAASRAALMRNAFVWNGFSRNPLAFNTCAIVIKRDQTSTFDVCRFPSKTSGAIYIRDPTNNWASTMRLQRPKSVS
ncbi:hypothetical protein BU26DRAFT_522222 [Trematosphaeria pertusa]|uniref:Uncharacterized protein n=1 Tax=Trematosphaeria pertusa TaxID=390896 RepID=A0A6A6I481_9PLEO|nr:uncharacterized protein BU26DRAFT_522222 [Trematosphaeria pertusa]KAF2245096.1 hypothetical protein BU26DRAFT_522222 [Trematosphaeria pertusa]